LVLNRSILAFLSGRPSIGFQQASLKVCPGAQARLIHFVDPKPDTNEKLNELFSRGCNILLFFLKKLLTPALFPLPLSLELLFLGIALLWFTKRQRVGKILVSVGAAFLYLCSSPVLITRAVTTWESAYRPLLAHTDDSGCIASDLPTVRWIVVLGGASSGDTKFPANLQLSVHSLSRVVEGIRQYRRCPGSKLIFTGRIVSLAGAEVAESLGIDKKDVVIENEPRDTEEEAAVVGLRVHREPLVLVTSADHMPRAMELFRQAGMEPTAAVANHTSNLREWHPGMLYPAPSAFVQATSLFREYYGMAWAKVKGALRI
jgi:uncharacterized SAM-binding protein YcdF (DUF218 family)